MSRFWAGSSASESEEEDDKISKIQEDEEDSEEESSEMESEQASEESEAALDWSDSDKDSDVHVRRMIPKHTQTMNEIQQINEKIRNALNINDWTTIQTQYEQLNKSVEKYMKVTNSQAVPNSYIIVLTELEDGLAERLADKQAVKKMHAPNAKSLNRMKQQLKKNNINYKDLIDQYRKNPEEFEQEEEIPTAEQEREQQQIQQQQQQELAQEQEEELTYERINLKVRETFESRGRRNVNRREQIKVLQGLFEKAMGPAQRLLILEYLISFIFDGVSNMARTLTRAQWKQCIDYMYQVMQILDEHRNITADEKFEDSFERKEEVEGEPITVWGNIVAQVERLDEELFKSLQIADHKTNEFKDRLSDQPLYMALTDKVFKYYKRLDQNEKVARIAIKQMEHYYFFTELAYNALKQFVRTQSTQQQQNGVTQEAEQETHTQNGVENGHENGVVSAPKAKDEDSWVNLKIPQDFQIPEDQQALLDFLQETCFKYGDERIKYRATLCRVYNLCIHNYYYQARDLMLLSRAIEAISTLDIMTLVLYNRALAQLGLCAFRAGHIQESFQILNELYSQGRIRELLAQGMVQNRNQEKSPEQEKLEKSRQMPFHLHINLEVLEAQHLITAMLIEVPHMAANPVNAKTKQSSKQFYRYLDEYDRKLYTGTPESVRDHIMAATKSLQKGQWKKSLEYITKLQCWNMVPDKQRILDMIQEKLKDVALRTYLFSYSTCYQSISLDSLQDMFELSQKRVHSMVSKMMIQEEIQGSWDEPTKTITIQKVDVTRVQAQAVGLIDKVSLLVDMNERALALGTGSFSQFDDEQQPQRKGIDEGMHSGGRGRSRAFGMGQQIGYLKNSGDGYERKWDYRGMRRGQRNQFSQRGNYNRQKMVQLGQSEGGRGRRNYYNRDQQHYNRDQPHYNRDNQYNRESQQQTRE